MNEEKFTECCFCKKIIERRYGNNPAPVESAEKDCCNECNEKIVIPYRIKLLQKQNK